MLPTALVTGASSGIGATYAARLAARGHRLVLVARDARRLDAAAMRLGNAEALPADLSTQAGLAAVEARLADPAIGLVVNAAGLGPSGTVAASDPAQLDAMVQLNVLALHRMNLAAARAFAGRGGAIVNIASVVALMPEAFNASYAASKAFVLALTQGLAAEYPRIRFQAVLPGLTRTEIFERAGVDIARLDPAMVMEVGTLVDAALAGFELGELVTIPSLPDAAGWSALEAARAALAPGLSRREAAPRYAA